jgi:nicotinamidase-related amidase
MTSPQTLRDPLADPLLTPQNAALVIIDFQPVQVSSIVTMEKRLLIANVANLAKTARLFDLPVVLTTVNVATGLNTPTITAITDVLPQAKPIDRTAINAWEDED